MQKIVQAAVLAALGLVLVSQKANAQDINVVINGQPVAFTGTPPQEVNGSVLVPLRGVFEQLGADVQYNPDSKTINAERGSTNVSLTLGSQTAYVNSQPQQLAQEPTVMMGTTLVPLRFVAEAFGAYVDWQPQTSTVQIQTSPSSAVAVGPPPSPQPMQQDQTTDVSGHISQIDQVGSPSDITVSSSTGAVDVHIGDHSRIGLDEPGGMRPGMASQLRQGDEITAHLWPNGTAKFISIHFTSYVGRVAGIQSTGDGDTVVILDNGQTVTLDPNVSIIRDNQVDSDGLHRGEHVSIRVRTGGHRGYSVDIS
jgi:hypothetical protein